MKRLIVFVAVVLVAGIASAQGGAVTSVNATGVIQFDVAASNWIVIANPFIDLGGKTKLKISDILGPANTASTPAGMRVSFWRNQRWRQELVHGVFGWLPGTNDFDRSEGLFVYTPTAITIRLMGEVPDRRAYTVVTNVVADGLTLVGFAYPVDTAITNTALSDKVAHSGDKLNYWQTNKWKQITCNGVFGWLPAGFVFEAGKGYFYQRAGGFDWVENKPYLWP